MAYYTFFQSVFTSRLEGGDRGKAMKRLRVPPLGDKVSVTLYRPKCLFENYTKISGDRTLPT